MVTQITLRWLDIIDIIIVAYLLYQVLLWLRGTAGMQLLRGLLIILLFYIVAERFGLYTVHWLFEKFVTVILVAVIIVFQPELRRALERIGRGRFLMRLSGAEAKSSRIVRHIIDAVEIMTEDKIGALIVIERNTGLNEFLESGVRLDSNVSEEMLLSIFSPKSPLHDGAVIIQGDRLMAAGCLLPLSDSLLIDKRLGTRHRAALGISEQTDALVVVVSERGGTISIAESGYLTRFLTKDMLSEKLFEAFSAAAPAFFAWFRKKRDRQSAAPEVKEGNKGER